MSSFQESAAKTTVRQLLREACERLRRGRLTYLGLPGEFATDLKVLGSLLENAICVEREASVLEEVRRSVSLLPLKTCVFVKQNMWDYLGDRYSSEPLVADVTFLDYCGGGITKEDAFAEEIGALRNYFRKHAKYPNRAFVFAWTYMPRDKGKRHYLTALEKTISDERLLAAARASGGMLLRSTAIRLFLWKCLHDHDMLANLVQHVVYKGVMNAIILVLSKGTDEQCAHELQAPDCLLTDPAWVYDEGDATPRAVHLPIS